PAGEDEGRETNDESTFVYRPSSLVRHRVAAARRTRLGAAGLVTHHWRCSMLDPRKIGHTGITWPTEPVEQKVTDVAAVGFTAFETFGHVIEQYPGGAPAFRDLIQRHGLQYAASYCARTYIDPARVPEDVEQVMKWARLSKEAGAETIVVSCQRREKETYSNAEYLGLAR